MSIDKIPFIYVYTRAQAIEDGVLVNLSTTPEWQEAGFKMPVACTSTVWSSCIEWTDADSQAQTHQDQTGRLWDVLWMLRTMITVNGENPLFFELWVVPRDGKSRKARRTQLKAVCGPGDYAEPVITIMLPNED